MRNRIHLIRRAAALLAPLAILATAAALPAAAVPGEIVGPAITLESVDGHNVYAGSMPVAPVEGGGYLGISATARFKHWSQRTTLVYEQRKLKIQRVSSAGVPSRRFARSEIGRGVVIGRTYEVLDMRRIFSMGKGVYIAWATANGYAPNHDDDWARTILVAFNGTTGKLVRGFGKDGILVYGAKGSRQEVDGRSFGTYAASVGDGRLAVCGHNERFLKNPGSQAGTVTAVPWAGTVSSKSKAIEPFIFDGKIVNEPSSRTASVYLSCSRVAPGPNGRTYFVRYSGDDDYPFTGKRITAFNASGTPDTSFGAEGSVELFTALPIARFARMLVLRVFVDADGRIYVAGRLGEEGNKGWVARLLPDGAVDVTFGQAGIVWVDSFAVSDLTGAGPGRVLVTGLTSDSLAAAGWLDSSGRWDRNFYGSGVHIYSGTASTSFRLLNEGPNAVLWNLSDSKQRKLPGGIEGLSIVTMSNSLSLDSSIATLRREKSGSLAVKGYASSPTGLSRVEVGIGERDRQPKSWSPVDGLYKWSVSIRPSELRKNSVVYSRAISTEGTAETGFSESDKNRLPAVKR